MFRKTRWGWEIKVFHTKHWWGKFIYVRLHHRTSQQYHNHRTEWHCSLRGVGKYYPRELHRLAHGLYFELAYGRPNQTDIYRVADDYGRL